MTNRNELVGRWKLSQESRSAQKNILERVQNTWLLSADHSPYGLVGNRIDFRGLDFSNAKISSADFEGIDFSTCSFRNSWIEKSLFNNVTFGGCDLSEISDHGNRFHDCTFAQTNFNGAALGYLGSNYNKCNFERASFSKTVFVRAQFDESVFQNCKLKGVDFDASSFESCQFIGRVEDVWFRDGYGYKADEQRFGIPRKNRMNKVSFAEAELISPTFCGQCELTTIILPKTGHYVMIRNLLKAISYVENRTQDWIQLEKSEADIFIQAYTSQVTIQTEYIFNLNDLEKEHGHVVGRKLFQLLCEQD